MRQTRQALGYLVKILLGECLTNHLWNLWKVNFLWGLLLLLLLGSVSCADSNAVNAQFAVNQTTWYRFDSPQVLSVSDPGEGFSGNWVPYAQAVRATDLYGNGKTAWVAVSGLGLLRFEDSGGIPLVIKANSALDLRGYRTDRVFMFQNKVFMSLYQEPLQAMKIDLKPPISLAWWDQRFAFLNYYPIISQNVNPNRQAVKTQLNLEAGQIDFFWKSWAQDSWTWQKSTFSLTNGSESDLEPWDDTQPSYSRLGSEWLPMVIQLKNREKIQKNRAVLRVAGQPTQDYFVDPEIKNNEENGIFLAQGNAGKIALTSKGLLVYQGSDSSNIKTFRLANLDTAGNYTGAVALEHGFLLSWETYFRGYSGPAGLVYIPKAILN